MYRVCIQFFIVTMSYCDIISQPILLQPISQPVLQPQSRLIVKADTPSPSPIIQFDDISEEFKEVFSALGGSSEIDDELLQVEQYFMNAERRESSENVQEEELEVENMKLKCIIRDLADMVETLADANNFLVFMIFLLFMITITRFCTKE